MTPIPRWIYHNQPRTYLSNSGLRMKPISQRMCSLLMRPSILPHQNKLFLKANQAQNRIRPLSPRVTMKKNTMMRQSQKTKNWQGRINRSIKRPCFKITPHSAEYQKWTLISSYLIALSSILRLFMIRSIPGTIIIQRVIMIQLKLILLNREQTLHMKCGWLHLRT